MKDTAATAYKKINVYDLTTNYYIDQITCFEHPIAVCMNYYDKNCSDCYIMLSKLFGVYLLGDDKQNSDKIFDIINDEFGISIKSKNVLNPKVITECMDRNSLIISGVNLYDIFYSEHFLRDYWGHWILINGYNNYNGTINIVDNSHFGELGHKYGDFILTYKMLDKANKSYKKRFGEKNSCLIISQKEKFDYRKILTYILKQYETIDVRNMSSYRQITILNEMNKLSHSDENYADYYTDEFKKKLININKYREVFYDLLFQSMRKFGYINSKSNECINVARNLNNEWKCYTLRKAVQAINDEHVSVSLTENMYILEEKMQVIVKEFLDFLECEDECENDKNASDNIITYELENNKDEIISGSDDEIIFDFTKSKLYNWWIEDDAPKVKIVSDDYSVMNYNEAMQVDSVMNIQMGEECNGGELFQAGFYVRTNINDNYYMCAVENNEKWSLDKVGYEGRKKPVNSKYNIFIIVSKGKIVFGSKEDGIEKILFKEEIIHEGVYELGLVCKTW